MMHGVLAAVANRQAVVDVLLEIGAQIRAVTFDYWDQVLRQQKVSSIFFGIFLDLWKVALQEFQLQCCCKQQSICIH